MFPNQPQHEQQIPANPKLWHMLVLQAKAKFHPYPSPAASHWVHSHYVQSGGQFVDSQKKLSKRDQAEKKKDDKKK